MQYTGWLRLPADGATDEATELAKILIEHAHTNFTPSVVLGSQSVFDSCGARLFVGLTRTQTTDATAAISTR